MINVKLETIQPDNNYNSGQPIRQITILCISDFEL
jgi:hypothetical protein